MYVRLAVKSGAIIPALLMLPNVAWMLLPAPAPGTAATLPLVLTLAENVARVATLALPFFCALHLKKRYSRFAIAGMTLALLIYYAAWTRFFLGGGTPDLLSAPLLGIPSPLAFAPIALLILSAYVLDSRWMFGASVLFGALHIWASTLRS